MREIAIIGHTDIVADICKELIVKGIMFIYNKQMYQDREEHHINTSWDEGIRIIIKTAKKLNLEWREVDLAGMPSRD